MSFNERREQIKQRVCDAVEAYRFEYIPQTRWKEPLLGFARADDPLFDDLKRLVSPTHAHPYDFLSDAKTVITFFIPFQTSVSRSNISDDCASREWAIAYLETNRLIKFISEILSDYLEQFGKKTHIFPATHNFDEIKLISDWSHRHIAYIAGLGTFGLNNMLVTSQGCCGRVGSLITEWDIEPTSVITNELCRYKIDGSCARCAERCPHGALTVNGFDRHRCYQACLENSRAFPDLPLTDVCGKCVVGIPCSHTNPSKKRFEISE